MQSRTYLEARARQLLALGPCDGAWRLVTIDFGTEARRHGCEFLMCFALESTPGTGAFAEIRFALPRPSDADPVFVLTLGEVLGL